MLGCVCVCVCMCRATWTARICISTVLHSSGVVQRDVYETIRLLLLHFPTLKNEFSFFSLFSLFFSSLFFSLSLSLFFSLSLSGR